MVAGLYDVLTIGGVPSVLLRVAVKVGDLAHEPPDQGPMQQPRNCSTRNLAHSNSTRSLTGCGKVAISKKRP
jgi:hypothetical protein